MTEKTIRSWIADGFGVLKAGAKGSGNGATVDLTVLIPWYLEENALDVAKTRLASSQADKHEMENALRRGELLEVAVVEHEWSDLVAAFRAKMLAVPSKLAPQLTNVADARIVASLIGGEINEALSDLAGDSGHSRGKGARTANGRAAEAADGKPVGRRRAAAKQRIKRGAGTVAH